MKFSIITVSYNSGHGLQETVESCLSQTHGDFELIIKDGLSNDGSTDFVKDITDSRVRLISAKDSGIYNAMSILCHRRLCDLHELWRYVL